MTATLSEIQVATLRQQFERVSQQGDEAIVAFAEEHEDILGEGDFRDITRTAEQAYDRLHAVETQEQYSQDAQADQDEQKSEDEADCERRAKIAGIFSQKGFTEAAAAVETDLEDVDAKTLVWINQTLIRDIPDSGIYGWAKWHAYKHANAARAMAQDKAENTTCGLFKRFLSQLRSAENSLSVVKTVPKSVHPKLLGQARQSLERAKGVRFSGWALSAIERLINSADGNNPVSQVLRTDPEMAGKVAVAAERQRALTLIRALEGRVEQGISALEQKIQERRHDHGRKQR